ncbi:hypothetical protein HSB1_45420 [Halogranum salarium B-1]|uniref:Uncharacterized protein n=1 Tax=Halogranum salarium B-1 TaxID=1210908 RepID=J3JD40_9EURY|nr:hypothetical protein HSB1_45420 [Halogranum salarium B-1]
MRREKEAESSHYRVSSAVGRHHLNIALFPLRASLRIDTGDEFPLMSVGPSSAYERSSPV